MTSDPRFAIPPSARPILPSPLRRLVFATLGLLAACVRVLTLPGRRRASGAKPRILVLEPYGMGDVLALQPLVRAWCDAGNTVVVATRADWHPLLVPHPGLTCLEFRPPWAAPATPRKYQGLLGWPRAFAALARSLSRHARGTRGVDVRGDVRSVLLLYFAGCGTVETLTHYFTANDCRVFRGAARRRPVDRTVERWRLNAVFAADDGLVLRPPSVDHLRPAGAVPDPVRVGLVPLTPWIGKQWPPEAWHALIEGLRLRHLAPVALCGPGERAAALQAVGGDVPVEEVGDVAGWVAALARCGGVLSVNTGPMHLAAALDRPLVVVEGSSRLPLWAPASLRARVVHHQDVAGCAPCHQVGTASDCARRCMALVTPAEVLAAFDELQARPAGTGPALNSSVR